ncbi:hypothetical protein Tco_0032258 [Tanacetum coccineum]
MSDSEDSTVTYTEAPLSPEFVPKPVYPEFMPPEDEVFPAEEQPLPAVVSPTTDSPGYIADSNPDEDEVDPEEDLEEDPKEDPTDYPTDGGDDDDDEMSHPMMTRMRIMMLRRTRMRRRSTQLRLTLSYHLYTVLRLGCKPHALGDSSKEYSQKVNNMLLNDFSLADPEWIPRFRTKTYPAESDQKDKIAHAMDDNGYPQKRYMKYIMNVR